MDKVYIVLRCQKIVKVYKDKETAEKQVNAYIEIQEMFTRRDFEIIEYKVV